MDIIEPRVQEIIDRDQDIPNNYPNHAGNAYLRGVAKRNDLINQHFN